MFPRRFFAGRYFAPVYFPESDGGAVDAGGYVGGIVTITVRVGGTVTLGGEA